VFITVRDINLKNREIGCPEGFLIEEKGRILNPDLVDAFCSEIKKKENTQDCIEIN